MATWTKTAAIERMEKNLKLQEAMQHEPRLHPIVNAAKDQQAVSGYQRIPRYYELKALVEAVWEGSNGKMVWEDADAAIRAIDDLLPPGLAETKAADENATRKQRFEGMRLTEGHIVRFIPTRFIWGWGVWDQKTARIVDGIYTSKEMALERADYLTEDPTQADQNYYDKGTHFSGKVYYGDDDEA